MRHGNKINKLSRTASHRKAMLQNMACSLIKHKNINTTVAKAKALRKFVEPLITRSKNDTQHNRRMAFNYLQDKHAVKELFTEVADKVGDRPGGYTRVLKLGLRAGDNAEMAMIELIDFNEFYEPKKKKSSSKKKRSRRGGSKSKSAAAETTTEVVEEAVSNEVEPIEAEEVKENVEASTEVETVEEVVAEAEEVVSNEEADANESKDSTDAAEGADNTETEENKEDKA